MPTLLERYLQGQHTEVWEEIRSYPILEEPVRSEILLVAQETMRRVGRNTDRIATRLSEHGWKPLYAGLRTPPGDSDERVVKPLCVYDR